MRQDRTQKNPQPQMKEVTAEELAKSFDEYNENIRVYDEKYNNIVPQNYRVLVRVYKTMWNCTLEEEKTTASSGGITRTKINPFPYSTKAIIIATDQETYTVGETVLLQPEAIQLVGNYEKGKRPMFLFGNEDFFEEGFLMIPVNMILAKIKD